MSIVFDRLTKHYGGHAVVDQVSLKVDDGELFVLLGASGSGKSTILRLIAGLTQPDDGQILLHGRDVTGLPPQQRGIGFVFQNYSIFRHMSVAENIEFGLKIRKVPPAERAKQRDQLLDMVGLAGLGSRTADQLSGGQQQRVALARALAYEPSVLLLDEPFGALDVKIRAQLRRSLKEIQERLGVTTIMVTHDQDEAFELADRIGVVERGHLLEVGSPETLYARPQSMFMATFLGAGTVLVGSAQGGRAHFGPLSLPIPAEAPHEEGSPVRVLIRPEQVVLSAEAPNGTTAVVGRRTPVEPHRVDQMALGARATNGTTAVVERGTPVELHRVDQLALSAEAPNGTAVVGRGTIIEQSFAGATRRLRLRLPSLPDTRQVAPPAAFGEEGLLVDAVVPAEAPLDSQQPWVSLRDWHILPQPRPRLLVCDAGAGPTAPLAVAQHLAEGLGASTNVLGVAPEPGAGEALSAALTHRRQEAGLVDAKQRVRFGNRAQQIASEQAETFYEMVVLAASDKPGAHPDRLGEPLKTLLEQARVPVLVVKREPARLRRVLICTAAGEPGKTDVRVGGRLARSLGAAVTLLHVTQGSAAPNPLVGVHLGRAVATLRALDVTPEVRLRSAARPAEGILAETREGNYDLLVVGNHGPQSRSLFGLDDVTRQVLAGTDKPVLVVPAEEVRLD